MKQEVKLIFASCLFLWAVAMYELHGSLLDAVLKEYLTKFLMRVL